MLPMLFLMVGNLIQLNVTGQFAYISMFIYPCFSCMSILLQGADGILLGPETLRGMYPIEAIKTVGRICAEVSTYQ